MASQDSDYTQKAEELLPARRGREGISDFDWPGVTYGTAPDFAGDYWAGYYGNAFLYPPYFLDSQKRGEALPFYITERQLKIIRDRNRRLVAENEFAVSAIQNRISYIVGTGLNYQVLPIHDDPTDPDESVDKLAKKAQRIVDIFVEANRLWEHEQETVFRVDRDGEAFIRLFYHSSGLMRVRWIEPEHVRSPDGDADPATSFGIATDPRDIESIRGYYVIESPLYSTEPKFVKADKIRHIKMGLDSSSKRGLPLLYSVEANLRRAEELLAALTMTTKTRAKIALIRRITGSNKTAAQRLKDEAETAQQFDPVTNGVNNVEQYKLGTILTASNNVDYEYPDVGNNQAGIEVLKAELRAIAARLVMPEPMLTADASGGTYSSFLVAEAPATRNFQRLQRFYRGVFGESRAPQHESLIWLQLAYAVEVGLIDARALTKLRVIAKAPDIVQRDPDKAASAHKVYVDMGAESLHDVAGSLGLNYDQVKRQRAEEGLPDPAQLGQALAGGMPGDVGINPQQQPGGGEQPEEDQGPGGMNENGDYEFDESVFN